MNILVLDTIHGGKTIGEFLQKLGHNVDLVDVYRHIDGISEEDALDRSYDLMIAPVHLIPSHPLLCKISAPCISHHEAVSWILGRLHGYIEVTGSRGKTTTVFALQKVIGGFIQTSAGLLNGEGQVLDKLSITPASLLNLSKYAPMSVIAEISLGFCGVGDLGILTSGEDYRFAGGMKSALETKLESAKNLPLLLVPQGVHYKSDNVINSGDIISIIDDVMYYEYRGRKGHINNSILLNDAYKVPLSLAASAALILGYNPDVISDFTGVSGRHEVRYVNGKTIIDNSNSGVNAGTAISAADTGRQIEKSGKMCMIIGQESASVCENFKTSEIFRALEKSKPDYVILIPGDKSISTNLIKEWCINHQVEFFEEKDEKTALKVSMELKCSLIIGSVKKWR